MMDTSQDHVAAPAPQPAPVTARKLKAADQIALQKDAAPLPAGATEACPLVKRSVIEARVVGDDGKPLMDVAVQLKKNAGEVLRGKTDLEGVVRFEQLEAGSYQLGLYQLDGDAWELEASEPLAPDRNSSQGEAEWAAPVSAGQVEEFTHRVRQGECTSKLADRYGFFADTVWNWPKNAELKLLREDKNILNPGDEIVIPPKREKAVVVETGMRYQLRRLGIPELLRIRFVEEGVARANIPYLISFQTQQGVVLCNRLGTTDADGVLVESVLPSITFAEVTLTDDLGDEVFQFTIGTIDSIDSDNGVLSRLHNLYFESAQGESGSLEELREAVREFQKFYDMDPTGVADDATRAKLREISLC
ncbi:peptidoglycan-binding protein [Oxalobacteraceae bacterium]|nr:peptidoglycan-binding protein [Oxalobacteraceae bacterium]